MVHKKRRENTFILDNLLQVRRNHSPPLVV